MIAQAKGTQFTWNAAHVAELSKINGIELTAKTIDVTTHDTPDAYTREMPSLLTAGDVSIEGFCDPADTAGQQAMLADFNNRQLRQGKIIFPSVTGTSWTFDGYVTGIKIGDAPVDGMIPFTATIKPFGKPVLAVATATGLTTTFFSLSNSAVVIPAPSGSVFTYTASVLTGVTSITITPVATGTQTIKVNGSVVISGTPSGAIVLGTAGSVTPVTIEVSDTDKASKIYTIYVARA